MAADNRAIPGMTTPPLVGREREQGVLRDRLTAALAGPGSLILINGEAGIGKTALAEALCREAAEQGALVLVGRCYDLTETPPYGPWVELFARYRPLDESPLLPPAFAARGMIGEVASQAALFMQVTGFLTAVASQQPLVLLLDDLHWADPASLDLLRVIARSLETLPLLLLATYRRDELMRSHPLHTLLPMLVREAHAVRCDLHPLAEDDLRRLIETHYHLGPEDATRLIVYLHRRSEGNPFFLGELTRTLEEEMVLHPTTGGWSLGDLTAIGVPPLLRQVIEGRLVRLGEEAQRLLAIGAVIGQEVPLVVWQSVAGTVGESLLTAIERAETAHLLVGARDGTRVRFAHALIRETLYEEMTAARRRHWHLRTGEALAAMQGDAADAVAYHFEQAGDERAVTWLVQAGDVAQRAYAWLTAAQRYEAALAHLDAGSETDTLRATLHYRVARMLSFSDPQRAIGHINAMHQIATMLDDHALIAYALGQRGRLHAFAGALETALTDLAACMDATDALAPSDIVRLAGLEGIRTPLQTGRSPLVLQLARSGRSAEALAIAKNTPAKYRSLATENELAMENLSIGLVIAHALQGEPGPAIEAFAEVRSGVISVGDFHALGFLLLIALRMVALSFHTDDLTRRRRLAQEGEQAWAKAIGVTPDLPPPFPALPLRLLEGHWSEGREVALAVSESNFAVMRVHAISMLGPLARAQGDAALAWVQVHALLPDGPATRPGTVPFFEALILQRLASALALDAGDTATARMWLEMHKSWLEWSGAVLGRADGHLAWARYYRATGDLAAATHHAREAVVCATEPRQPLVLLAAHRLLGELDTDAERLDAATTHLTEALALADACAAPYERALTLLALGELHEAMGDATTATALLDEARAICLPLGAKPALARAGAIAARLAGSLSSAASYPDALTPREVDVLRLIATGHSNREIAATLFISTRTVNRHIENLYQKIGAHSKADATAYAFRQHLT